MCYVHIMECYSAIRRNKNCQYSVKWVHLEKLILFLKEGTHRKMYITRSHSLRKLEQGNSQNQEVRWTEEGERGGYVFIGTEVTWDGMEMFSM